LDIKRLLVYGDSTVVINQVNKSWDRNKENMDAYYLEVHNLENKFYGLEFHHVARDNNTAADVLSKLGSTSAQVPIGVLVHELHMPSILELAVVWTSLGGYQDRLIGGPLGLPGLRCTTPDGVKHKLYGGEVLG
jgi:hypothetical protein